MKKQITEESGEHKAWKDEAKEIKNPEQLKVFVSHLIDDYDHDYGTIVHAMSAAMLAAYNVLNESDNGGITGFQASCLGWEMIGKFFQKMPIGGRIINYHDLLYPQMEEKFNSISKKTFEKVVAEAKHNIKVNNTAHPRVIAHWQFIADGGIPFGLKVLDDDTED